MVDELTVHDRDELVRKLSCQLRSMGIQKGTIDARLG